MYIRGFADLIENDEMVVVSIVNHKQSKIVIKHTPWYISRAPYRKPVSTNVMEIIIIICRYERYIPHKPLKVGNVLS